jgi:hypothetical protein
MKNGVFVLKPAIFIVLLSCSQQTKPVNPRQKNSFNKIIVRHVGDLQFEKSYSFLMSPTLSQKEIDKLFEETEKSNPKLVVMKKDDSLYKLLQNFDFISNQELLLKYFKYSSAEKLKLSDTVLGNIDIYFDRDKHRRGQWRIHAIIPGDSSQFIMGYAMELKYALLDIVPGGYKEVVVLDEGHIINTDLFNLLVFEFIEQ